MNKIVMLGDSLSARGNWNQLLGVNYITNHGIDGDNIKGVQNRLDYIFYEELELVFIMIGINDLCCMVEAYEVWANCIKTMV